MKLDEDDLEAYFAKILGIDNWTSHFQSDPVSLLHKINIRQVTRVYFHNLQIATVPLTDRKIPSEAEIVQENLGGEGGNCLHINYFMKILLQSAGYDVTTVAGTIGNFARNHVMNIVRISEQESYLIDVACGCPCPCPVPLHALPFTTPSCGGSTSQFRKVTDTQFAKIQIGGGFFRKEFGDGTTEKALITFDMTPTDLGQFEEGMTRVWTDEENSAFCRNLFLFRHYFVRDRDGDHEEIIVDNEGVDEEGGGVTLEFVLVFGKNILFGSATKREVKQFSTYEEMVPLILKYFPKVDPSLLVKSFDYLNTITPMEVRL